jgi:glutamyl/glutaminyl-tRNA synthetase
VTDEISSVFASAAPSRSGAALAASVASRLTADRITRFAPAPTGALHLGHVVNAVYIWGLARAIGGRVILRIEDHDRQRARGEFERGLLDDLDWLGFAADVYPSHEYRLGRCEGRQSERDRVYREALAPLVAAGLVYGCRCTRASLATAHGQPGMSSSEGPPPRELRYAGTCRDLNIPATDGVGWRLRLEAGPESSIEAFDDALVGPQVQAPSTQCGDLLLRDRLGNWTYQCVAAIDDAVQGVTFVVRGEDLLSSTGRQIRLARLIGRPAPPLFVHHPLVMKSAEQKLSKSDGDSGIADLRAAGWSAAQIIGRAAALAGLIARPEPLSASDLPALFTPR